MGNTKAFALGKELAFAEAISGGSMIIETGSYTGTGGGDWHQITLSKMSSWYIAILYGDSFHTRVRNSLAPLIMIHGAEQATTTGVYNGSYCYLCCWIRDSTNTRIEMSNWAMSTTLDNAFATFDVEDDLYNWIAFGS